MSSKSQHVIPGGGKWRVVRSGATRASGTFETQEEAIARARELARSEHSELYVHGSDGRIRERSSYARTVGVKV
ncbi:MAG: DUF2188 domain-containing protein [Devosia nanyangense]|uniref:DUF2188 domain-containing protein n=1 Tax=Devosia nanyangense TaxID=1228055 RepID=A0A933L278_9HYPH|nr:DUF2188 domain-containing protein [Devosia nanyangense]